MIKRMNKVTSLLVAAAAVMSLVPATAVSAAERLETKTGTIDSAIAFDGGNYIYDGYKTSDDATGVYYNAGDKDKLLEDFNADSITKYGSKYAKVVDGSDEYVVDLSTGQVVADETTAEDKDAAQAKLATALKKTDRYSSSVTKTSDLDGKIDQILKGQFGEVWYQYNTDVNGQNDIGEIKGVIDITVPDFNASSIKIAGVRFDKADLAGTTGYTSGQANSFAVEVASKKANFTNGFDFTNVDPATGTVTLTQTAAGTFVQADLDAMIANTSLSENVTAQLVTEGQAPGAVLVAGAKAVIKLTPKDLTKDVKMTGITINVGVPTKTGYGDKQGLINAIKAASFTNYTAEVIDKTGGNSVEVKLTQKIGATLNQSTIDANDYESVATPIVIQTGVAGTNNTGAKGFIGFSNQNGNYIDASYIANMYVYSKATDTIKKIENFGKEDTDTKLKVDLVSLKTIDQDKDYIYAIATVNVTGDGATSGTQNFFQKISKARGDQKDGAYLPKSVTSYQITDAYDSGDADDAVTSINEAQDIRVINDVIYATKNASDKVTVTTIKLKKDKVAVDGTTKKIDTYLAEQDVQEDQDIAGANAVSIDVNGNTWAINKGEILKFDGTKFTTVYNCDRTFDTLEVYNADSLIAWKAGDDVYTTVSKTAAGETPVETPVQNKGWVKTAAGWTFYNNEGSQTKGQWVNDGGVWYMIKADGIMATGWYNDNGTWYYMQGSGAMKTGWLNDNGTWYYLNGSGAMKTGWVNDNGTWYYLNGSGAMLSNTTVEGYRLGASGAWVK
jgi:hypothetical protein